MGRELKRVPLDFDWPVGKTWHGYVNPHYRQCPACHDGMGETMAMSRLSDLVWLIMLSGDDAVRGRCHPYFYNVGGLHRSDGAVPSGDMAELTAGLAGREGSGLGHDSVDSWSATKKILAAAGLPETWGRCEHCGGDGVDPEIRDAYEAWEDFEPPEGAGFQLWETTSDGSPISPVFESLDALCQWLAETGASVFGDSTADAARWREMLDENFVRHEEGNMVFI